MRRPKPLRTLKEPVGAPDHFTIEEADAAILAVMAERGETPLLDTVERIDEVQPRVSASRSSERRPVIRRRKR
jgi:hypothetical protein